ncbi:LysR family transcriptional regulator [Paenibacillus antri]|uniref:LysR family transcriptional regulator n=1 Tax=Paenibacillus antri TaxID=2582848 RepID=A0A5R9GIB4_9BACL|nr:LysR family transcriptional regulator [Paenibacillus antri]TLS54246.1 LysR family transcriptional regulator [Paenibacillus antri]
MELRQLQYFITVARLEHVTHAAESLRVAQSAVSRQIHQLEEELGVALFSPKGRNLQLTPAGKLFMSRAETILTDLDRAVLDLQEFMNPEAGEIRIGFPHSLGIHLLPSVIAEYRAEHPNVKFVLKQGTYHVLIRELLEGEIDLAFISPFPKEREEVEGELLLTEELKIILPPNHLLARHTTIRLEQLKDDSFVMFSESYSLRSIVLEACRKAGFSPRIGFEGEEMDTIRGLVAAGLGVSLLPEMALIETSPMMPVSVRVTEPQVLRTIGLIRRRGEKLPLVAEAFRNFVIRHMDTKNRLP